MSRSGNPRRTSASSRRSPARSPRPGARRDVPRDEVARGPTGLEGRGDRGGRRDAVHGGDQRTIGIAEIGPALRAERVDVVIGYLPNALPDWPGLGADIRMDTVRRLRVVAALPIPRDVSADFHDNLLARCERHGFRPRVVATGNTIQALLELVAGGVGVVAVSDNAASLRPVGA